MTIFTIGHHLIAWAIWDPCGLGLALLGLSSGTWIYDVFHPSYHLFVVAIDHHHADLASSQSVSSHHGLADPSFVSDLAIDHVGPIDHVCLVASVGLAVYADLFSCFPLIAFASSHLAVSSDLVLVVAKFRFTPTNDPSYTFLPTSLGPLRRLDPAVMAPTVIMVDL